MFIKNHYPTLLIIHGPHRPYITSQKFNKSLCRKTNLRRIYLMMALRLYQANQVRYNEHQRKTEMSFFEPFCSTFHQYWA